MRKSIDKKMVSAPELAKLWGVSPAKVLLWVRAGQLRALNLARSTQGRPRYAIDLADVEAFERTRVVVPEGSNASSGRVRRRTPPAKDYFAN